MVTPATVCLSPTSLRIPTVTPEFLPFASCTTGCCIHQNGATSHSVLWQSPWLLNLLPQGLFHFQGWDASLMALSGAPIPVSLTILSGAPIPVSLTILSGVPIPVSLTILSGAPIPAHSPVRRNCCGFLYQSQLQAWCRHNGCTRWPQQFPS